MPHHDDDPLIVITGAAGFIGSGVVRHLNDQGYSNLLLVDEADPGSKEHNLFGKQWVDLIPREELFDWLEGKRERNRLHHPPRRLYRHPRTRSRLSPQE